jgi:hypothetical protein
MLGWVAIFAALNFLHTPLQVIDVDRVVQIGFVNLLLRAKSKSESLDELAKFGHGESFLGWLHGNVRVNPSVSSLTRHSLE